jgi:3-deoxy-D-manno-octulosonic-acid transferase
MVRHIYSLVFYLILPLVWLRVFWRARKEPRYSEDLGQRMGELQSARLSPVWVHAVSAGETIAAGNLVFELLRAGEQVIVSNMTPAGRERAEAMFGNHEGLQIVYAPYDLPHGVRRFFDRVNPKALIVIDTELWPNTIACANSLQVPVFLVNGRLSEKSASGYGRVSILSKPMFRGIDTVFAQSETQAQRFSELGSRHVITTGSVKFDASLPVDFHSKVSEFEKKFTDRNVLLGASTHEGEESVLLSAFSDMNDPSAILILAPRHTRRLADVEKHIRDQDLTYQRHSKGEPLDRETKVYLVDTMGDLMYFYGVSLSAFVGGSLVDVGGHNPMEPGLLGKPIMMGPYRRNIADIAELFEQAGGLVSVTGIDDVRSFWERTMDEAERAKISSAVLSVMEQHSGALSRVLDTLLPRLKSSKVE